MKKIFLIITLLFVVTNISSASEIYKTRGYRGFGDIGFTTGLGEMGSYINRFEISTTHGYQFNKYFFAGGGMGIGSYYNLDDAICIIPLYVDVRANLPFGKYIPFFDFKLGYSIASDGTDSGTSGAYIAPSVGCAFMLTHKFGLTASVGYSFQWSNVYEAYYIYNTLYYYSENRNLGGLSFKVGVIF